jgi:beta-aspartyl-peptidase (threonine type)
MKAIAVHGGAGREPADTRAPRQAGVARAAERGWRVLAAGGSALAAVIEAVVELEDDPHFNAGLGSVLTEEGVVEMSGVRNPIRLAHAILQEGREVLVVGEAARATAQRHGVSLCAPDALVTARARERWQARGAAPGETVGAAACDAHGHVAAATSTGGIARKRCGRVGDSAVIGAGTYADDALGAGSATGPGEAIIRVTLVRAALDLITRGADPAGAAREALGQLALRLGEQAGVILIDARGRLGIAHTTPSMVAAYQTEAAGPAVID